MTALSAMVDMSVMARADSLLGCVGIAPFFVPTVKKYDFNPDSLLPVVDDLASIVSSVKESAKALDKPFGGIGSWEGEARDRAEEYKECVAQWWQIALDFLLGILDWLIAIIKYILKVLWIICEWLSYITAWLSAIAWAITAGAAAGFWVLGGIPTAILAAISGVISAIAAVSWLLAALIKILDWLLSELQNLIRRGRQSLCGGSVVTEPPDWDPDSGVPSWPF